MAGAVRIRFFELNYTLLLTLNLKPRYPFRFDFQNVLQMSSLILSLTSLAESLILWFLTHTGRGFVPCFTLIFKT